MNNNSRRRREKGIVLLLFPACGMRIITLERDRNRLSRSYSSSSLSGRRKLKLAKYGCRASCSQVYLLVGSLSRHFWKQNNINKSHCGQELLKRGSRKKEKKYFEKIHPIRGEIPRHLGLDRFPHIRLGNAQAGKELVVLEHFHVPWDQVTCIRRRY